jgi:hypothetical protein
LGKDALYSKETTHLAQHNTWAVHGEHMMIWQDRSTHLDVASSEQAPYSLALAALTVVTIAVVGAVDDDDEDDDDDDDDVVVVFVVVVVEVAVDG